MSFDNSVALTWCFEDERTPATLALLHRVAEAGAVAPGLWPLEATNALFSAERRGRLSASRRDRLLRFLQELPIAIDDEAPRHAWDAVTDLTKRFRLSAYDAAYLELAVRRNLPLASLDHALRNAATVLGLSLLGAAEPR